MNALILSGGKSTRMGRPKALLTYHGRPQIFHLEQLLAPFCDAVYVSCTPQQAADFRAAGWSFGMITDQPEWGDIGPVNGLLSAFQVSGGPWLVVGCDYPLLTAMDIQQLIEGRDHECMATVFRHPVSGFAEPLIGIYEPAAGAALTVWVAEGNSSLRRFLEQFAVRFLTPAFADHLKSVDTFEGYLGFDQK